MLLSMRRKLDHILRITSVLLVLSGVTAGCATAAEQETVTVFSAGSTINAVTDIAGLFMQQKQGRVVTSFAASSTLAKQIENGAPAEVYISANAKWMDYLEEKKIIDAATRFDLLSNRIVLVAPAGSKVIHVDIKTGFALADLLGDDRLAMGDPDHVPAGIYGRKALETLGIWDSVAGKVARSKDVRAALALVERGETPLGVVYTTDAAISKNVSVVGTFPETCHPPIVYPAALVGSRHSQVARRFIEFLKTPDAKAVFKRYGFSVR
jgi:molybdate transport system substrate-binding protein